MTLCDGRHSCGYGERKHKWRRPRPGCWLREPFLFAASPTPRSRKRFPRGCFPQPRNLDAHSPRSARLPSACLRGCYSTSPWGNHSQRRGRFSSSHRRTTGHQWHGLGDRIFLIGSPKLLPSPVPTARTTDQLLNYWRLILQSSSAHRDLVPLMRPPNPVC